MLVPWVLRGTIKVWSVSGWVGRGVDCGLCDGKVRLR